MKTTFRSFLCAFLLFLLLLQPATVQAGGGKGGTDIRGPAGSGSFGQSVTVLPNGNFVVTDPYYDEGTTANVGAVYLYNGASKALIGVMKGATAQDMVGYGYVTVLADGNFLVNSPIWDNSTITNAGAVTWCSKTSGCPASISAANSLVGSHNSDSIGFWSVWVVNSDTYIVPNTMWDNGLAAEAGAVTFCSTSSPCTGAITSGNSLVGTTGGDHVGSGSIYKLPGGGFVVTVTGWDNGLAVDAGAVRFCSSANACYGEISSSNSIVGSHNNDHVGNSIYILSDNAFLVRSTEWDDGTTTDVGAVTWCSGSSSCYGAVSFSNSLIGEHTGDRIGSSGILSLESGRYAVFSPEWDRGGTSDAGAVTFCTMGGCSGYISAANSIMGATKDDMVGWTNARLPYSGNYLVLSPYWDDAGVVDAGAVTWCSGISGCKNFEIDNSNSLVGGSAGDGPGLDAVASYDVNNYMVMFPNWDNGGTEDAGAVKWCPGGSGCAGTLEASGNLVGSHTGDQVGLAGTEMGEGRYAVISYNWNGTAAGAGAMTFCTYLSGCSETVSSGNSLVGGSDGDHVGMGSMNWDENALVFSSPNWHYGSATDAGALTFCRLDYLTNCSGFISASNSLIGTHASDQVGGSGNFYFLANGNYLIPIPSWNNGQGAVSFCNGGSGCTGPVSTDNSLVGSHNGDEVGHSMLLTGTGNYVIGSPGWDNGLIQDAGAATFCSGTSGCKGSVSAANSLVGTRTNERVSYSWLEGLSNNDYLVTGEYWPSGAMYGEGSVAWCDGANGCTGSASWYPRRAAGTISESERLQGHYDPVNNQVLVGRPEDNIVTVLGAKIEYVLFLPMVKK